MRINPHTKHHLHLTLGQQAADNMRNGMGSWIFVFSFLGFMIIWAAANIWWLNNKGFDPYPFILLNLFLSMLAGLQGAILLISNKRQDEITAALAQSDYETNIEAEKRIEALQESIARIENEKLDRIFLTLNMLMDMNKQPEQKKNAEQLPENSKEFENWLKDKYE